MSKYIVKCNEECMAFHKWESFEHNDLVQHLKPHGFTPSKTTPGLWQYNQSETTFTLVVDDFSVRYDSLKHIKQLINAIKLKYDLTID